jgi:hypothetical protein
VKSDWQRAEEAIARANELRGARPDETPEPGTAAWWRAQGDYHQNLGYGYRYGSPTDLGRADSHYREARLCYREASKLEHSGKKRSRR